MSQQSARRPYVAGNWKMNNSEEEAAQLAKAVAAATADLRCDIALCVPFPHMGAVRDVLEGGVFVGAQDVYWEPKGAFTGEVSVLMLADFCEVVIIGHSERRQFFGETDEHVNKKLKAVLASSTIAPIVCVGELLEERKSGQTEEVLRRQLLGAFAEVELSQRITVAYEPVWAIGTGETATPEIAQEASLFIRSVLRELCGQVADEIRIQYGGSVNPANASALLSQPDIDGALVGGASLIAAQFAAICAAA